MVILTMDRILKILFIGNDVYLNNIKGALEAFDLSDIRKWLAPKLGFSEYEHVWTCSFGGIGQDEREFRTL
jgi:hypothetical protein